MQHNYATVVHQKQRENIPPMKKVYHLVCDFGIPEKQCCFWVRAAMHIMWLSAREKRNSRPSIHLQHPAKSIQNPLRQ